MSSDVKMPNFDNLGVVVEPPLKNQKIDAGLKQTLSRLLGWNYLLEKFDFLKTTADGVLLVSTDATKSEEANHSVATVTNASAQVLSENVNRKSFTLMNNGVIPIYFKLGETALVASSMVLNAGISWSDDMYIGRVDAIVSAATCELRMIEHI